MTTVFLPQVNTQTSNMAEPSPPPSPRTENKPHHDPHSSFTTHLSSIPFFVRLGDYSPRFTAVLKTAAQFTASFVPSAVVARADGFADNLLTRLEHGVPALFEAAVAKPVASVRTAAHIYGDAIKQRGGDVYKSYIEPAVCAYTNGPLRWVNDRFEGAVETGMPKSYREAVVENGGKDEVEVYRTARLVRNAVERGRARVWMPMKGVAERTEEDVLKGGDVTRGEVRGVPARVWGGVGYARGVLTEEVQRGGLMGLLKAGEMCAGEMAGTGMVVVAKAAGVVSGMWGLGRKKVKAA